MTEQNKRKLSEPLEIELSLLAGRLGLTRGQLVNKIAASQGITRKAVYGWLQKIREGDRPDLENRLKGAIEKLKQEEGI